MSCNEDATANDKPKLPPPFPMSNSSSSSTYDDDELAADTHPSSSLMSEQRMRYAHVTRGLYHNDTLCSYVPNTSCSRRQSLPACEDHASCHVRNGWHSLEPYCAGNSYYAQLEYDCQPAYVMCTEGLTVVSNAFSGLIYSPSFPGSFRLADKSEPCYLTIHLPKDHHAEITLDHFDMLRTAKCIGDYVEIQQYKEVTATSEVTAASVVASRKRSMALGKHFSSLVLD